MNKELQEFLEKLFGDNMLSLAEGKEMTQEEVISCIQSLVSSKNSLQTTVDNLTTEKSSLTEQITNLNAEVANLKEMATVGKNHIASLRENAVTTYKKLMGDKADETIVTMLNAETTGIVTLISLTKDYQSRLEEKFPMVCASCGSHDVAVLLLLQRMTMRIKLRNLQLLQMQKPSLLRKPLKTCTRRNSSNNR